MSSPKISLVIGNGFSMSFGVYSGLSKEMDSQEPLEWEVTCPSTGGRLIDSLGKLKSICDKNEDKSSFEIFKLALNEKYCKSIGIESRDAVLESRHFLTFAFSEYTKRQTRAMDEN